LSAGDASIPEENPKSQVWGWKDGPFVATSCCTGKMNLSGILGRRFCRGDPFPGKAADCGLPKVRRTRLGGIRTAKEDWAKYGLAKGKELPHGVVEFGLKNKETKETKVVKRRISYCGVRKIDMYCIFSQDTALYRDAYT